MTTGLGGLRAAAAALAAADPTALSPAALADQVVELRRLIDGLEGTWSRLVAVLDGSATLSVASPAVEITLAVVEAVPGWCWRDAWPGDRRSAPP